MRLTVSNLVLWSLFFCEALGVTAVYLAPDVQRLIVLGIVMCGLISSRLLNFLSDRFLFALMTGVVLTGIFIGYNGNQVAVTSTCIVAIHAVLWCAQDQKRYRYWRIGVAVLEIILAAVLSTQTYMFLVIFLFMMGCSMSLSFLFLAENFENRDPAALARPIRFSFVFSVFILSLFVFLLGLVIFPILPRSNWAGDNSPQAQVGYNEVVSFKDPTLAWGDGEPRTLMWLFLGKGKSTFPMGLIRGKTLDVFDGIEWRSGIKQYNTGRSVGFGDGELIDIVRDPLPTDVLPIPYGATIIEVESKDSPHLTVSGEWILNAKRSKRVRYSVRLGKQANFNEKDIPRKIHYNYPEQLNSSRMDELIQRLNTSGSELARVQKVESFFYKGKFAFDLGQVDAASPGKIHPIESFLFDTKKGHCELFASAAAMIFRKMGMASRMVVGFRVPNRRNNDLVSIKNSDAHAWVEVWTKDKGWIPVDVSPETPLPNILYEGLNNAFDYFSAYWNKYILSYEFDSFSLKRLWGSLGPVVPVLLLLGLLFLIARKIKAMLGPLREMRKPRNRIGKIFSALDPCSVSDRTYIEVKQHYQALRFGKKEPDLKDVSEFSRHLKQITRAVESKSVK